MLMSYMNRLVVLAFFGFVLMALCLTADAQCAPLLAQPPLSGVGLPVPYGNFGSGITDSWYTTAGSGNSFNTDTFVNSFAGPSAVQGCGGPFGFGGWGCGPCGFGGCGIPSAFSSWGPFQSGVGGNFGNQFSAASGVARSQTFGLQPIGLAFGVPVAGPGGLVFT
jgi:hypothetical protein